MNELQKFYLKRIQLQNYILKEKTNHIDFNRILEIKNLKVYCNLLKNSLV